jgi:hypothetical protein
VSGLLAEAGPVVEATQVPQEIVVVPSETIKPSSPVAEPTQSVPEVPVVTAEVPATEPVQTAEQLPTVVAQEPVQEPVQPAQQSPTIVPGSTSVTPGQNSQSSQTSGASPAQTPTRTSVSGDTTGAKDEFSDGMPPIPSLETPLKIATGFSSIDTLLARLLLMFGIAATRDQSDDNSPQDIQALLEKMPLNQLAFDYSLLPKNISVPYDAPINIDDNSVTAKPSDEVKPSSPAQTAKPGTAAQTPIQQAPAQQTPQTQTPAQTPPQTQNPVEQQTPKTDTAPDCLDQGEIGVGPCGDGAAQAPAQTPEQKPAETTPEKPDPTKTPSKTSETPPASGPPIQPGNAETPRSQNGSGFNLQSLLGPLMQILPRLMNETPEQRIQYPDLGVCPSTASPVGVCNGIWRSISNASSSCPQQWECVPTQSGTTSPQYSSATPGAQTSSEISAAIEDIASPPPASSAPSAPAPKTGASKAITDALKALTSTVKDIAPFNAETQNPATIAPVSGQAPPSIPELWNNLLSGLAKFLSGVAGTSATSTTQVLVSTDLGAQAQPTNNPSATINFLQSVAGFLQSFFRPANAQ